MITPPITRPITSRIASAIAGARVGGAVSYDYYIDASTGNDSNDGLTAGTAWASLSKIAGSLVAEGETKTVFVAADTYDTADDYIEVITVSVVGELKVVFQSGCVMDGTAANAIEPTNGVEADGSAAFTLKLHGNGLTIQNYAEGTASSPNGVGCRGSAILYAYNVHCDNCDDGFSAHGSSKMYLFNCSAQGAEKSPFIHVENAVVVANDCTFTQSASGSLQVTGGATTTSVTFNRCTIIPIYASGGVATGGNGVVYNNCVLGTESNPVKMFGYTGSRSYINDSYINLFIDGNTLADLTRCYGQLSTRVRGGGGINVKNCVLTGPATTYSSVLYTNYDPGSSSKFVFNNNIIYDSAAFDNLGATLAGYVMAAASEFHNNILYSGVSYSANLIAADTGGQIAGTITSDPLIGDATGYAMIDYAFGDGSPAEGAGTPSGDIGFSEADAA